MPKDGGPEEPPGTPDLMALLSLGVYMAVCIGLGVGLGFFADSRLGTAPILVLVGFALGLTAAVLGAYREMKKYL